MGGFYQTLANNEPDIKKKGQIELKVLQFEDSAAQEQRFLDYVEENF